MASTAAMTAVFGTTELLEDILITATLQGMTHEELLLAQRVSRDWKATIEGSPLLQKLLGFRAATTDQDFEFLYQWSQRRLSLGDLSSQTRELQFAEQNGRSVTFDVFVSPLVLRVLDDWPLDFPIADKDGTRDSRDLCSDVALRSYKGYLANTFTYFSNERTRRQDLDKHHFMKTGPMRVRFEKWNKIESSMHRMLLTQPPPTSANLEYDDKHGEDKIKIVKSPTGVKLGGIWLAGMEVDTPYDQKKACWVEDEYGYDSDIVDKLKNFWAQKGEVYDGEDSDDSNVSDEDSDEGSEEDWEDYYGGDWSSEASEDDWEDEDSEDNDLEGWGSDDD
ncbi:hypothetical protein CLAFUW4_09216 [Fulvia fulva]|nr:hypothetical protein CLAFUR4_09222 [Fulvia fulva]KAK4614993.1 hypothetical protein CLAFUR0_09214 [Fulvia fulva]WPV20168.1 hypothetical protein CLAFUW4_09216 [Fulvia fulva]WPV35555.1 hypothetical protein CLAFUW7_09217 [Fulvia fulva]